jgi:hypothetical protein
MGIRAVPQQPSPEPKATCHSCHRPISVLKSGKCVYCGEPIPGALRVVEARPSLPSEFFFSTQPRADKLSIRAKWMRRAVAMGVSSLLVAAIMGPCMKS